MSGGALAAANYNRSHARCHPCPRAPLPLIAEGHVSAGTRLPVATWLVLEIRWIRTRHAALGWMQAHGESASYARWVPVPGGGAYAYQWNTAATSPAIEGVFSLGFGASGPWPLCLIGEPGVSAIALAGKRPELAAWQRELGPLFPEAQFEWILLESGQAGMR